MRQYVPYTLGLHPSSGGGAPHVSVFPSLGNMVLRNLASSLRDLHQRKRVQRTDSEMTVKTVWSRVYRVAIRTGSRPLKKREGVPVHPRRAVGLTVHVTVGKGSVYLEATAVLKPFSAQGTLTFVGSSLVCKDQHTLEVLS